MPLDRSAIERPRAAAFTRILACGLALAAAAAAARAGGCAACSIPTAVPPSLVWDGETYAAAWAAPESNKIDVYVHRFQFRADASASAHVAAEPERVIRVDSLRGSPELAAGPDGFLLFVHRGDGDLLALPLDGAGRVRGEPRRVGRRTETVCTAPGWNGDFYAAAWLATESGGGSRLTLAFLDRTGAISRSSGMSVPAGGSCALAVDDDATALVYGGPNAAVLTIASATGSVDVELEAHARVLRLAATEHGFALLVRTSSGGLRVTEFARRGRAERGFDLPAAVAAETVDLGANRAGLFVSWTDARRAWLAGLDDDGALSGRWYARGGSRPSGTRALGRASECATAWTSLGGLVVHAVMATDCPRQLR